MFRGSAFGQEQQQDELRVKSAEQAPVTAGERLAFDLSVWAESATPDAPEHITNHIRRLVSADDDPEQRAAAIDLLANTERRAVRTSLLDKGSKTLGAMIRISDDARQEFDATGYRKGGLDRAEARLFPFAKWGNALMKEIVAYHDDISETENAENTLSNARAAALRNTADPEAQPLLQDASIKRCAQKVIQLSNSTAILELIQHPDDPITEDLLDQLTLVIRRSADAAIQNKHSLRARVDLEKQPQGSFDLQSVKDGVDLSIATIKLTHQALGTAELTRLHNRIKAAQHPQA